MEIKDLDMNLLTVFDALFETRSVTLASKTIGLSQPAMSYSLAKLRESFDDPLFVRIDNKMQPTPRALTMAPQVKRILEIVKGELLNFSKFDPASSSRQYTFRGRQSGGMWRYVVLRSCPSGGLRPPPSFTSLRTTYRHIPPA